MADEPSGNDDTGDGWNGSSATDPDVGPTADPTENEWGTAGRTNPGDRRDRDDTDDGWDRIPLDLSGSSDGDETDTEGEDENDDEYTPEASSTPIEPGDPDLENVLFVILGAIAMVLVFVRLVMIPLG